MRAGVCQISITPFIGIELSGFVKRVQPSIGVRDELYARVLCLEENGRKFLWMHCDLIGFDRELARRIRRAISGDLNLEMSQIMLSATHTHYGPATMFFRNGGAMDREYIHILERYLLGAARAALRDMVEVKLYFCEGKSEITKDRRVSSKHSHADYRLPVICLRRQDGSNLAVIANYAVHHVSQGGNSREISADMAGVAAKFAQRNLPGNPVVLFTNGACGNINPLYYSDVGTFEWAEVYGTALGTEVVRAACLSDLCEDQKLESRETELSLPLDILPPDRIQSECEASIKACLRPEDSDYARNRLIEAFSLWRDDVLKAIQAGIAPHFVETTLQVVRLGPIFFAGIGAEAFSRTADELRAQHEPYTYVIGFANGVLGYLPFREIYLEGGEEVADEYKLYGFFMVAPGSYEMLREKAVELLRALK